jgi:predicted DNA-binding transcriptional regulator AlpA
MLRGAMRGATGNPIQRIADRFGSVTDMARQIGMSQPAVWDWVSRGYVPSKRIPMIIETGRAMDPPIDLEPNDFFPRKYRKARYRRQTP